MLGGKFAEKVGDYFIEKQQLKNKLKLTVLQGKIDLQTAKVQSKIAQQNHIQNWEMRSLELHSKGWKDELVLLVVLFPYIGCFIPVVQDYINTGFEYLAKMPYWAVGLTVAICLAIYGIRHKNASRIQAPGLRDKDVEPEG